jgi:hypothetical protein
MPGFLHDLALDLGFPDYGIYVLFGAWAAFGVLVWFFNRGR